MGERTLEFTAPETPDEAGLMLAGSWSRQMAKMGYTQEPGGEENARVYKYGRWPVGVIVICVILFPIGLLALFWGKTYFYVSIELRPNDGSDGETEVCVSGTAPRSHWKAFRRWDLSDVRAADQEEASESPEEPAPSA
jgi:hypothetical protein